MTRASPATASTTVLADGGGGGGGAGREGDESGADNEGAGGRDGGGGAGAGSEADSSTDPSLMTLFLKNILGLGPAEGPNVRLGPTPAEPKTRTCDKSIIRAFIDVKVKELRPFLQDDDYLAAEREESAAARGDTTIVELPPAAPALRQPAPPRESVRRYRRLRRRIHRALLRETVTNATVDLIIRTIDDMIANMAAGRCGRARAAAPRSAPPAAARPAAWKLEWQKIREKYSDLFQGNDSVPQERLNEIVGSLMEKLPSFFANVLRDGETLAEGYGIRCERLAGAGAAAGAGAGARSLPAGAGAGNATCKGTTWICSGELRRFLVRLFKAVNESGARVMHDYLEMYKIDVNIDRVLGRKGIVDTLREINREAETEVCKTYAKKIQSLLINKGKKRDLYRVDLKDLIKNITENVKMQTNQIIRVKMEPIDTELKERILKDLDDNMRVELDRLAGDADRTICSAFATCNGRYTVRRARGGGAGAGGGGGVYVRVQLQLEEEAGRAPPPPPPAAANYTGFSDVPIQIKYSTFDKNTYDMKYINVTRTTRFYSQNSNTQITQ